jgi:thiol-disulfide isomerase/thioredoxin
LPVGQAQQSDDKVTIRASGVLLDTTAVHDATEVIIGQGPGEVLHDQDIGVREVRFDISVRISKRWSAWAAVGGRWANLAIVYRDATGAPVTILNPSLHHRTETVYGWIDTELGGELTLPVDSGRRRKFALRTRLGLSLPTGLTQEDPFVLGDKGLSHQHIQTGTGTFDPMLSVSAGGVVKDWQWGASLWTRQILYANSKGYQGGSRYAAGVSLGRSITIVNLRASLDATHESAEIWGGTKHTDDGNLGRTDLLAGLTASVRVAPQLAMDVSVRVPVYTRVVGGQLEYPAIVGAGVTWSFPDGKAPGPAKNGHGHDHKHGDEHGEHGDEHGEHDEHGDEHDEHAKTPNGKNDHDHSQGIPGRPASAFVQTLNPQRYDLQLSKQHLTVVDFSASWCVPCKTLTPLLVSRISSATNAVLRIADVSDPESALAKGHFGDKQYTLPLVEVYDRNGTKIAAFRDSPEVIMLALDKLLRNSSAEKIVP